MGCEDGDEDCPWLAGLLKELEYAVVRNSECIAASAGLISSAGLDLLGARGLYQGYQAVRSGSLLKQWATGQLGRRNPLTSSAGMAGFWEVKAGQAQQSAILLPSADDAALDYVTDQAFDFTGLIPIVGTVVQAVETGRSCN